MSAGVADDRILHLFFANLAGPSGPRSSVKVPAAIWPNVQIVNGGQRCYRPPLPGKNLFGLPRAC